MSKSVLPEKVFFSDSTISQAEKHKEFVELGLFDQLPEVTPEIGLLVVTRDDTKAFQITKINNNGTVEIGYTKEKEHVSKTIHLEDIRLVTDIGNALLKIKGYDTALGYIQRGTGTYFRPKIQNN